MDLQFIKDRLLESDIIENKPISIIWLITGSKTISNEINYRHEFPPIINKYFLTTDYNQYLIRIDPEYSNSDPIYPKHITRINYNWDSVGKKINNKIEYSDKMHIYTRKLEILEAEYSDIFEKLEKMTLEHDNLLLGLMDMTSISWYKKYYHKSNEKIWVCPGICFSNVNNPIYKPFISKNMWRYWNGETLQTLMTMKMEEWCPILAKWNSDIMINLLSLTSILKYVIMKDVTSDGTCIVYSKEFNNDIIMSHLLRRLQGNEYIYYIKYILSEWQSSEFIMLESYIRHLISSIYIDVQKIFIVKIKNKILNITNNSNQHYTLILKDINTIDNYINLELY